MVDPSLAIGGVEEHIRVEVSVSERSRKAPTSTSRSAQIRDTSDLEMPESMSRL
jgi:hypothetical protein